MRYIVIWLIVLYTQNCFTAFDPLPQGARINGMGLTLSSATNDPFGYNANPAALGNCQSMSFGSYHTQLFGLKELSQTTGVIILPTRIGGIGLGGQTFGNALYRESLIHGAWGKQITPSFYLGSLFRIGQLTIKGQGSATALWINAGLMYHFSEKFTFGFSITNLNQARIGQLRDPLPQTTRFGLGIRPIAGMLCNLELHKDVRYPLEIRYGLEAILIPSLAIRCGFTDAPQRITFGTGIQINKLKIDYAIVNHPILGVTHHASLIFTIRPDSPQSLFSR